MKKNAIVMLSGEPAHVLTRAAWVCLGGLALIVLALAMREFAPVSRSVAVVLVFVGMACMLVSGTLFLFVLIGAPRK